jgi:hypothetical protein
VKDCFQQGNAMQTIRYLLVVDSLTDPAHDAVHLPIDHDETVTIKKMLVLGDGDCLCGHFCVAVQMKAGLDWSSDIGKDHRHPWTCFEVCQYQHHLLTMTVVDARAFRRTILCAALDDVAVDTPKNNLDLLMSSCWTNHHENDAMMLIMPCDRFHAG